MSLLTVENLTKIFTVGKDEDAGTARLIIPDDLDITAHHRGTVAAMQTRPIVEIDETERLFDAPRHPPECVRV